MPHRIEMVTNNVGIGVFAGAGALIATFFNYVYGDSQATLILASLLVAAIVLDWISGSRASSKDGSYASEYGIDGVFRTAFILMIPMIGNFLDQLLATPSIFFGLLCFGLIYHVTRSAVANAVRAGWANWLPIALIEHLLNWAKNEIEHKTARAIQRANERAALMKADQKEGE